MAQVRWDVGVNHLHPDGSLSKICSVPTAEVQEHARRLNGIDDVLATCSLFDEGLMKYGLTQDMVMLFEGEVRRNNRVVLQGPILVADCDLDAEVVGLQIVSWWHYFHRRYFGRADRTNAVVNGGFEVDFTDWSDFGVGMTSKVIDHVNVAEGSGSARLVGTSNHTGGIEQTLAVINHPYLPGLPLMFNFEAMIDPAAVVEFGKFLNEGTIIGEIEIVWPGGSFTQPIYLTQGFGVGNFGRVTSGVVLAANVPYTTTVRLFAVDGAINWDSGQMFFPDSTSVAYPGQDQAVLLTNVINYAQDSASGKSPLGVALDAPDTGIFVMMGYSHAQHENIGDQVEAMTKRVNGFDFECDHATRTLRLRYPERGSTKPQWKLTLDRTISGGRIRADGSTVETSHVVLLNPELSEEGGAVDTSYYDGLILEGVDRAPVSMPLRQLDFLALERLRQRAGPAISATLRLHDKAGDLAGGIDPGDSVPVEIRKGIVQVAATWRVVDITERPPTGEITCDFTTAVSTPELYGYEAGYDDGGY